MALGKYPVPPPLPAAGEATFTPLESKAPPARREHRRYAVELDVHLRTEHNFYAGFTENLSAGGVFIATHTKWPTGSVLEFKITLPTGEVTGAGEVRWIREFSERVNAPPGIGIRFTRLSEGAEEAIQKFLAQREPIFFDDLDD